jgi:DNA-binding LacI/PurR family transcriptional regulator
MNNSSFNNPPLNASNKVTLKEIAREANVSISTVSRVLNGRGKSAAGREVSERIWEIVNRTNYIPNKAAQSLRSANRGKGELHGSIECLLARMPFSEKDQFFSELARSVEFEANSLGYDVKYSFTTKSLYNREAMSELSSCHADGIIIMGRCDKQVFSLLNQQFKSICYVGLNQLNGSCDQVICDGMEASKSAVNFLISLGHRHIGYVGEIQDEIRYLGYRNAMIENGIPTDSRLAKNVKLSYKGGYEGAKALISSSGGSITALFCANDNTAIGAMSALQEMGLSVPKDVSVIGVDNIATSRYLTPSLTTIAIPIEEMGKTAAKLLHDRIRGGHQVQIKAMLPSKIEIRESCMKLKTAK